MTSLLRCILIAILCCGAATASAQQRRDDLDDFPLQITTNPEGSGRTTGTPANQTGQRQTKGTVVGIKPMARIDSRFTNRINNRIRNRIDRYYDSNATTTTPFGAASDQLRTADPGRRR